jgi:hypothetical protein
MSPANVETQIVALLRRVRQRLTAPGTWLQGDFAATLEGHCQVADPHASCWCVEGAILAEVGPTPDLDVHRGAQLALMATIGLVGVGGLTLAGWNDAPGRTHDEVLGVLDLTLSRLDRALGVAA